MIRLAAIELKLFFIFDFEKCYHPSSINSMTKAPDKLCLFFKAINFYFSNVSRVCFELEITLQTILTFSNLISC